MAAFSRRHLRQQTAHPTLTSEDSYQPLDVESLVYPNSKFYEYPDEVPIEHWQLRNLISSPEPNIVNYVASHDIIQLNLETKTRTHIATLPWAPRCSASGHGFIVVGGGVDSNIAVIDVDPTQNDSQAGRYAAVDDPLPVFRHNQRSSERPPNVKIQHLGTDIVNSVTIHKLVPDEHERDAGVKEDVVAIFTNNDQTLRIYSLTHGTETWLEELPFATNHASISPDGERMIVVGDWQQAYFFTRRRLSDEDLERSAIKLASHVCGWEFLEVLDLHKPQAIEIAAYFSTAWHSDSWTCAVASEIGYVSVIDLKSILDEREKAGISEWELGAYAESIKRHQVVIPSSRPSAISGPGAIRALQFLPPPWDMLVWIESRDRVCVADLRDGMKMRQVVALDCDLPSTACINAESFINGTPTHGVFRPMHAMTGEFAVSGLGEASGGNGGPRSSPVRHGTLTLPSSPGLNNSNPLDTTWDSAENQRLIVDLGDIRVYQSETIHEFTGPRPISAPGNGRRDLAAAASAASQRTLALTNNATSRLNNADTEAGARRGQRSRSRSRTRARRHSGSGSGSRSRSRSADRIERRPVAVATESLLDVDRLNGHDDIDDTSFGERPLRNNGSNAERLPTSTAAAVARRSAGGLHANHPPLPPHHSQHLQHHQFLRPRSLHRTWAEIVTQRDPIYLNGGAGSGPSHASSTSGASPAAGFIEDLHLPMPSSRSNVSIGGVFDSSNIDINALRLRRNAQRARDRERERLHHQGTVPGGGGGGRRDFQMRLPDASRMREHLALAQQRAAAGAANGESEAARQQREAAELAASRVGAETYRAALALAAVGGPPGHAANMRALSSFIVDATAGSGTLTPAEEARVERMRAADRAADEARIERMRAAGQAAEPAADEAAGGGGGSRARHGIRLPDPNVMAAGSRAANRGNSGGGAPSTAEAANFAANGGSNAGGSQASSSMLSGVLRNSYSSRPPVPDAISEYQRRYNRNCDPENSFSATGLLLSEDGRKMWVGTKRGLFEFRFNLRGRLVFQSWETT